MYTVKTVTSRIANFFNSRKGRETAIVAIILLTGCVSFGLGRLSVLMERTPPVSIEYRGQTLSKGQGSIEEKKTFETNLAASAEAVATAENERVVASKNGSVYHLPWCAGGQKIKEENKVWYNSPEAARAAGLRPAGNCKGLE